MLIRFLDVTSCESVSGGNIHDTFNIIWVFGFYVPFKGVLSLAMSL